MTVEEGSAECPDCRRHRENYQVIGLSVFCLSLVSCGTLMPIAIPLALYLQVMSTRKCPACRDADRNAKAEKVDGAHLLSLNFLSDRRTDKKLEDKE